MVLVRVSPVLLLLLLLLPRLPEIHQVIMVLIRVSPVIRAATSAKCIQTVLIVFHWINASRSWALLVCLFRTWLLSCAQRGTHRPS